MINRLEILETAAKLTGGDRNKTYGSPVDNMQYTADLWNAYLDHHNRATIMAEDVAHMMALLKIARTRSGLFHTDNYVDAAAYVAIAGECAAFRTADD